MKSKGKSSYYTYAGLGICIAFLPLLVAAAQYEEGTLHDQSLLSTYLRVSKGKL